MLSLGSNVNTRTPPSCWHVNLGTIYLNVPLATVHHLYITSQFIVVIVVKEFKITLPNFMPALVVLCTHTHTHTDTCTSVLRPFFRDHPGEPVPEENFWTLWCKERLTEADTPTIQLGATSSGIKQCPPPLPPIFYRPDPLPAAQPTVSKHWRQLAHSD